MSTCYLIRTKSRSIFKYVFLCVLFLPLSVLANAQLAYENALTAYQKKAYEKAVIHLKNALQEEPDNLPARLLMAKTLTAQNKYLEAKSLFDEVIKQGASYSLFINDWGTLLLQLKLYQQIIDFDALVKLTPEQQVDWLMVKVSACLKIKNYTCAKQSYQLIGELTDNQSQQLNGLANIAIAQADFPQAKAYLAESLKHSPESSETIHLLGMLEKEQGSLEQALNYLLKAYQISPENPAILRHLADIYLALGDKDQAQLTVGKILQQQPNDPFAIIVNSQLTAGSTQHLKQVSEEKLAFLSEKVFALPNEMIDAEPTYLMLRGMISFFGQNYEQALRDFKVLYEKDNADKQAVILLAKAYFALGQNSAAVTLLEIHQKSLLDTPEVLLVLGEKYLAQAKTFKALNLLDALKRKHPELLGVKLFDIKIKLAREQYQSALTELDALLAQTPDSEQLLQVHSVLNLQAKRYPTALKSINRLLSQKSKQAEWLNIKAGIYIQQHKWEEAKQLLNTALAQNRELIGARYNLATIYRQQGDLVEARNMLESILAAVPDHSASLLLLANIETQQGKLESALNRYQALTAQDNENLAAIEGKLNVYMAQKNLNQALSELELLNRLSPDNGHYLLQRAYVYIALNQMDKARVEAMRINLLAQKRPFLLLALSQLQLELTDTRGAEKSLRRLLVLQPDSLKVALNLSELLLNTGQTEAAQAQLNQVEKQFPQSSALVMLQGRIAEQVGNIESAGDYYSRAFKLDNLNEVALAKLYHLTLKGYDHQIFLNTLTTIVNQFPERFFPRNLLAQFYFYQQNYVDAAKEYHRLAKVENNPNRPALFNRLAQIYLTTSLFDLNKAKAMIEKAFQLAGDDADILTTYGWIMSQQGELNQALGLLRKAYVLTPQNPALQYYLAATLAQSDRKQQAIQMLTELIKQGKSFNEANKAHALLNKLTSA